MNNEQKQAWSKPELTVYGDVEKLTGDNINKKAGSGDTITINGTTIGIPGGGVISAS